MSGRTGAVDDGRRRTSVASPAAPPKDVNVARDVVDENGRGCNVTSYLTKSDVYNDRSRSHTGDG